ncbi:hypothetical protein FWD20_03095 [Candidatus Saccharibacteria bacterium]|nr:hypothetical protein [Candidatus Saccharibacteria bacterium]
MKNGLKVRTNRESGQVSIITVIAFILLFSVIVVSFSRIMVTTLRQAVNDELAASARAAAEAGIEDAKRILSYCMTEGGSDCDMLDQVIEKSDCTTISSKTSLMNALQRKVVEGTGSSISVGDGGNSEEYLCLKITMITENYTGELTADGNVDGEKESDVIPLRFVDISGKSTPPKSILIQWHRTGTDDDKPATGLKAGSDLPPASEWKQGGVNPAVLRAEFVAVPKSGFTVEKLTENTRAVTLRPSKAYGTDAIPVSSSPNLYDLNSWRKQTTPNAVDRVFIMPVECNENGTGAYFEGHACSVAFTIPGDLNSSTYLFDTDTYDYYLRLQAIYRDTHFRISARSADEKLYFDRVQANVDVTGRARDSLKRLSVRLEPYDGRDGNRWWPDYVVDTAGKACKNMTVEAYEGKDECTD